MASIDLRSPFEVLKQDLTLPAAQPLAKPDSGANGPDGLIARWSLNSEDGATASDCSGNALTAQLRGAAKWARTVAPPAQGIELDGKTAYLESQDNPAYGGQECLSVALWFQAHRAKTPESNTETLAAKGEAWQLQRHARDGRLEFVLAGPTTPTNSPARGRPPVLNSRPVSDNEWHHVAATYDGRRAALYLDGQEESACEAKGPLAINTASLALGENSVTRGRFFDGRLKDVSIYRRALSAEQVQQLHKLGAAQ